MGESVYFIAFDADLMQPACVLLQAAFCGTVPNFSFLFPTETWLVHPTNGMRLYKVTLSELDKLSELARETAGLSAGNQLPEEMEHG